MAGNYPDIPGRRFALTQDGTKFFKLSADMAVSTAYDQNLSIIDDTDTDAVNEFYRDGWGGQSNPLGAYALVFPELRDIKGYWAWMEGATSIAGAVEYSTDTTNGADGTWTTHATSFTRSTLGTPYNRQNIVAVNWPAVKGVRFKYGNDDSAYNKRLYWHALHFFGNITAGQNPDRLVFWEPVNDVQIGAAYFDMAEIKQGETKDRTFRIKNLSSTLTANGVVLDRVSPSWAELATGIQFSPDGAVFTDTLDIGDLAPGALSSVITLRRTVAADEPAGEPKNGYLTATATSWT